MLILLFPLIFYSSSLTLSVSSSVDEHVNIGSSESIGEELCIVQVFSPLVSYPYRTIYFSFCLNLYFVKYRMEYLGVI
jgi:hypothetical protein